MRVEVIHDQHYNGGLWVYGQQQITDEQRPVGSRPLIADLYDSFASQRFHRHENIGRAATLVFTIVFRNGTRTRGELDADLCDQLLAALIHANHGSAGIVRTMVHFQHIFHRGHEFGRRSRRQAPALLQPGLEFVFFSVRRTVSCESSVTYSKATMRSANNRNVHRARPSGGLPQARATRWASALPSSRRS